MPSNHQIPATGFLSHLRHYHLLLFLAFIDTVFKLVFVLSSRKLIAMFLKKELNPIKLIGASLLLLAALFYIEDFIKLTLFPFYHQYHLIGFISLRIINLFLYIILLLSLFSAYALKLWMNTERQKRELIQNQLSTELNFLKAQINPHFIFNSLNSFFSIAQKNNVPQLEDGILKLSDLLRYSLYNTAKTNINLEREIRYIKDYIHLAELRFVPGEVETNFSVSGEMENRKIAPMILLPFVENSFKYGTAVERTSAIDIVLRCEKEKIYFKCVNSIYHDQEGNKEKGLGLENVKRRLEILYPGKHKLFFGEKENKFIVELEIMN